MVKTRYGQTAYPLTAAQKLHLYALQFCPKKQVLNIGSSLTIETDLDWEILRHAIYQAYDRCESMRLRLTKGNDGNIYQYIVPKEDREIEHFDFTGWQECHVTEKMEEWTGIPFKRMDAPLNRIVTIKLPDGFQGLYVLVDHMTMDAQSLILFLKDMIEIYCHLLGYEGSEYPKTMASYTRQLEKDLVYEKGNSASRRDQKFFEQLISSSEPIFTDIYGTKKLEEERIRYNNPNLRAVTNVSEHVTANITTFHLEGEPSARLLEFCKEQQVSMVCLLMMGLRTYLQKVNLVDDISINTTVARRATLTEKRSGGTRIHCFPFRTIVPKEDTFIEGIYKIRDGQNRLFRYANYSPSAYYAYRSQFYGLLPGQTYESMALTYQPLTMKEKGLDRLGDIQYKSARYTNGAASHTFYLTVSHRAEDNGLEFGFEYQTGVVTPELLEYVYYYLCRILFKGIEYPHMTVDEILKTV